MNPKEKAKDLVDKFLPEIRGADRYNYNLESMNVFIAKQCALIAADEIFNYQPYAYTIEQYDRVYKYWEEVKSEIQKLNTWQNLS